MHPATKSGPSPSRIRDFWAWIALCAMTLLVYEPTLRSGFIWDDDAHVTKSALQSLHGLWRIWFQLGSTQQYYPVLFSAFWVEHRLWGDAALGYHLTNVILHGTSAWLFARVLRRLWDGPSASPGPVGSAGVDRSLWRGTEWLAATIFALHPVAVESVAWISEQKNTLSTVFYLLATLTYLRFDERRGRGAASSWAAASLLFVLALLSKTVTATLPAALLVIFWWQRGHLSWRRDVRPLIPWFAAATAAGLFTAWVERKFIGAQGVAFDLTLGQRCLLAGRVIWFYLGKLVWPAHLIFVYPRWDVNSAAAAWAGYLAAALAVTAALWRLRRRWRGPLAAWLFFVGSLFPALGFFNVYPFLFSYVADHFQYLASLGIIAAASAGAALIFARASPAGRAAGGVVGGVLIATLGALTHAQSRTYKDLPTLYETTIARNPGCWMAYNNLGVWSFDHGESAKGLEQCEAALRLNPDYPEAHYNLGTHWLNEPGRLNDAIGQFQEALRLRPDYPEAHNNLGEAWSKPPERLDDAIAQYQEALRLNPDFAEAHSNLGHAWSTVAGRLSDAIAEYQEALRLKPDFAEAHNDLGSTWLNLPGRLNDAIAQFEEALRLKPDFAQAHNNLGNAWSRMPGRLNDAVAQYREALRLKPDFAEAHNNLGNAWSTTPGRSRDAIAEYQEALRLEPDFAQAHNNLGNAWSSLPGRLDDAIAQYREALRLKPDYSLARDNLGIALNNAGRPAEAVAQFEEELRRMPDIAEIHFNLAIALLQIPGRTPEAAAHLEECLRLQPDNTKARQILARIRAAQP